MHVIYSHSFENVYYTHYTSVKQRFFMYSKVYSECGKVIRCDIKPGSVEEYVNEPSLLEENVLSAI
jgi:hypothetical protein